MWDVLLLFSSICTAVVVGAPETVIGHRGERVDIRCPYDSGYEANPKYFCKGECIFGIRNIIIKSGSPAKDERFSLTDNTTARVFTVTITDLRTEDEGQYWCAVERTYNTDGALTDVYSEISLKFKLAVVVGAPETVIGHRGERVDIRCPYDSGYEANPKYFCRGNCLLPNKVIIKSGSPAKDERFSLTDDTTARVFTVTITDLRTEDEGRYWCAVERTYNTDGAIADVYSKIYLQVEQDKKTPEVSTLSPSPETQSSFSTTDLNPQSVTHRTETKTRRTTGNTTVKLDQPNTNLVSVAGGLGLALLVLTLCSGVFLILKKRKRKGGTALFQQSVQLNTETDRMYEEIPNSHATAVTSSANQTPASSANQTPASNLNFRPKVFTAYATVTNQQPDSNPSHTHNQVTDTDCDYYANMNPPEATQDSGTELIYTTVTHPQNIPTHPQIVTTNECPMYSVISHK
ncbi:CMRF35-like molecule 1 [Pseudorasbora parva]|uniref:CMRF35-like molecule 1 n=1 Tax=Pseudorasbora parva TaxID=51549 RepID=UPI00351EEF87